MTDLLDVLVLARCGNRDLDADVMETLGYCVRRCALTTRALAWRYKASSGHWCALPRLTHDMTDALRWWPPGCSLSLDVNGSGRLAAAKIRNEFHGNCGFESSCDQMATPELAIAWCIVAASRAGFRRRD